MRRADHLTAFMYLLSCNLEASSSWKPQGLSRSIMGLFYLLTLFNKLCNFVKSSSPYRAAFGNQRDTKFLMSHVRESSRHECDLKCHQQARSTTSVRTYSMCVSSVASNTLLMSRANDPEFHFKSFRIP
jgi:hypothetical protein